MEDAELVLKELRIDWETVLTEDYNPLKQALEIKRSSVKHSNYRNIYHRVEKVMEKIIEETYKGFSDSVLSYMECYNLTTSGLKEINEMMAILDRLKSIRINTDDIYKNYKDTEYLKIKNSVCEDLVEVKNKHEEFKRLYNQGSLLEAAINLQDVREMIKNKALYRIRGIDTYDSEVEADVRNVCDSVFERLDSFIFRDSIEYKEYFRIIVVLNRILKYDRYVYVNLERNIFRCIEEIIFNVNKEEDVEDDEEFRRETDEVCLLNSSPSVTVKYTIQTSKKIYCYYKDKPLFKSVPERSKKNVLVRRIVSKLKRIRHNIDFLRKLAESAFENLDEQSKNYYEEYSGFMVFCSSGGENVERIVQKVINRFIDVYTDCEKKDIDVGEFETINILDNINYSEEFDEKYPIYGRIINNRSLNEEKEEDFTLIFRPSIDICIDLYEYIPDENIKQRCMKYINKKEEDVLQKMILVFQEHRWDRNNYSNNTLWFLDAFLRILREIENIVRVFGEKSLNKTFSLISRKMEEKYSKYFTLQIISECFAQSKPCGKLLIISDKGKWSTLDCSEKSSDVHFLINLKNLSGFEETDIQKQTNFKKVENGENFKYFVDLDEKVKKCLKDFFVNSSVNNKELFFNKMKYEHVLFTINTLVDLSLADLAYKFAFSFKIDILLEIFYYFDIFYREGIFKNSFYIHKISQIVQEVYLFVDIAEIFELIDDYVIRNRIRLNVKKEEDMRDFLEGLRLLDESLSDVSDKYCLKKSISFIEEEIKKYNK